MSIVAGTILWALVLHQTYALISSGPRGGQSARELAAVDPTLGPFQFTDQSGRPFGSEELRDRVWIAAFIFTRCPASCPRITATMRGLQERLANTGVELVSISVDPKNDTPEVLDRYARANGALPGKWHFLTGPRDYTYDFIERRFRLTVKEATAEALERGAETVFHDVRLVLIDRGNRIVNYYPSDDPEQVQELLVRARRLDPPAWVRRLPGLNASLNGTCAILLLLGWTFIRTGRTRAHVACMVAALAVSSAFLCAYLVYHYYVGSVPFRGQGLTRTVYFTILLSHTLLAAAIVPLVAITLVRAMRKRFEAHMGLARVTLPIWLYVSLTGVIIYVMLYRLPLAG
jgi:protein SCO1/2/putative membrane protein